MRSVTVCWRSNGDAVGDHLHLGHAHAAGGNSRGAQTHARSHERAAGPSDSVLIGGMPSRRASSSLPVHSSSRSVDQHEVVIRTAGTPAFDIACPQLCCQSLAFSDLAGIFLNSGFSASPKQTAFAAITWLQRATLRRGRMQRGSDALWQEWDCWSGSTVAGGRAGSCGWW